MLNKDFDIEFECFLSHRCPSGDSNELQLKKCRASLEDCNAKDPGTKTCCECWREYIEQQEPDNAPLELNTVKNKKVKIGTITDMEPPKELGSSWISVNNRLPERSEKVLARYEDGDLFNGTVCYGMHNPFWCDDSRDDKSNTLAKRIVTHWMPLPKPPEDN